MRIAELVSRDAQRSAGGWHAMSASEGRGLDEARGGVNVECGVRSAELSEEGGASALPRGG